MSTQKETEEYANLKCGLCEAAVEFNDLYTHPCLNKYPGVFIVDETNYFYPRLDNGNVIFKLVNRDSEVADLVEDDNRENLDSNKRKSLTETTHEKPFKKQRSFSSRKELTDSTTQKVQNNNLSAKITKKQKSILTNNEVKILLREVKKREPLWNYQQRTKQNIKKLWQEVVSCEELNGKITTLDAKIKFKSLKDTFKKILSAESVPKGVSSEKNNLQPQWEFYNSMKFIKPYLIKNELQFNNSDVNDGVPSGEPANSGSAENISRLKKIVDKKINNMQKFILTDEEVKVLLSEIKKRTPLWKYTLKPKGNVDKLWEEVASSEELSGKISGKDAKTKFKSLKDTFRRILNAELKSKRSSSAKKDSEDEWKFYDSINFTRPYLLNNVPNLNIRRKADFSEDDNVNSDERSMDTDNSEKYSSEYNSRIKLKKTNDEKHKKKRKSILTDDEVGVLLNEVKKREPLWKHRYEPKENVDELWEEVASSERLGGKISGKEAKTKFKSLLDTYRKIVNAESIHKWDNLEHQWKFYNSMHFTRSYLYKRKSKFHKTRKMKYTTINNFEDPEVTKNNKTTFSDDIITRSIEDPSTLVTVYFPKDYNKNARLLGKDIDSTVTMISSSLRVLPENVQRKVSKE